MLVWALQPSHCGILGMSLTLFGPHCAYEAGMLELLVSLNDGLSWTPVTHDWVSLEFRGACSQGGNVNSLTFWLSWISQEPISKARSRAKIGIPGGPWAPWSPFSPFEPGRPQDPFSPLTPATKNTHIFKKGSGKSPSFYRKYF